MYVKQSKHLHRLKQKEKEFMLKQHRRQFERLETSFLMLTRGVYIS